MTYIQASRILLDENSFSEKEQLMAAKKVYKLSLKALKVAVAYEHLRNAAGFMLRWSMFFGGFSVALISFLRLAYNTTAVYTVPITETLRLELLLIIGIVSAYVGDKLNNKERRARHEKH